MTEMIPTARGLRLWNTEALRIVDDRVKRDLDGLQTRLQGATTVGEHQDLLQAIGVLKQSEGLTSWLHEIARMETAIRGKHARTMFRAVKQAHQSRQAAFAELASGFLKQYPAGKYAQRVETMKLQLREMQLRRDRLIVAGLGCANARQFVRKSEAIYQFLRKYPKHAESSKMRRSADPARIFGTRKQWRVTLKAFGTFASSRDHAFQILVDGSSKLWFDPRGSGKGRTGSRPISVYWRPGQKLHIALWDLFGENERVAWLEQADSLAILMLTGETSMDQLKDGWGPHLDGGNGSATFSLDGVSSQDKQLIRDYLSPGGKWSGP